MLYAQPLAGAASTAQRAYRDCWFNWVELHHAAGNMSLFGGRTLIDLRIPTGKPGREGSAAIQGYCAHPSPDALLLVTLPGLDWTEEKAAWLKSLVEAGAAVKADSAESGRVAGLDFYSFATSAAKR